MLEIKKITPLSDRVLVKPVELGERKVGAILIADVNNERPLLAQVIACGPGRLSEFGKMIDDFDVKPGDYVILPKLGFTRTEVDGEEYWVGPYREILGKVEVENN